MEGYAGPSQNGGHELAQLHTKCIFHDFFVYTISYGPTDLYLLKEFSKNVSFGNFCKLVL